MQSERKRIGDFEVVREIGRGGMGVVYEATQLSLNRPVALKVLPSGTTPEQRDIDRFQREAQAAAALDHPNIVPIYAQGEEEGTHYYAMKLVQGSSLDKVIREAREKWEASRAGGRTTTLSQKYFRIAARFIMEAAEALEYAHSQGVIHRDIKPHNLILTPDGHLVITDFGLARFLSAPSITISGEMMGTPAYMSPEQVRAERQVIDQRTDIYSLGVTLYEMLALYIPFWGETREAVLRQILVKDPRPLRRLHPRIPRDLETICAKAIEKDPNRRYQSAKLFAHDLHCFLEGLPITARPIGPMGHLYRRAMRRKALTAALVCVALALIVGRLQVYRTSLRGAETRRELYLEMGHEAFDVRDYVLARQRLLQAAELRWGPRLHLLFWRLARLSGATSFRTLKRHTGDVTALAFSPDGKLLASASADETVKLWEADTGGHRRTLGGHAGRVLSVAFSPNGKLLASGSSDKKVRLWDVATGVRLETLEGHTDIVCTVAFSPDGKLLASGSSQSTTGWYEKEVRLWDAATGEALRTLDHPSHEGRGRTLCFSPDSKVLAVTARRLVRLWDVATGAEVGALKTDEGGWSKSRLNRGVSGVRFSADGDLLACSSGACGKARLWDVSTRKQLRSVGFYDVGDRVVAFSPDLKLFACGVEVWDAVTGEELRSLRDPGSVCSLAFAPGGKVVASGSTDHTIKLWAVPELMDHRTLGRTLRGRNVGVNSIAFSPDGKILASGGSDRTIRLWAVATGEELRTLNGSGIVKSVAFSPDGKLLGSGGKYTEVWRVPAATKVWTRGVSASSVSFSPDGRLLASCSSDGSITLWDVAARGGPRTLRGHTDGVLSVAFSPDGTLLASGSEDETAKIWDVATGEELRTLSGHHEESRSGNATGAVNSVAFGRDGRLLLSASGDKTIKLWDAVTGEEVRTIRAHGDEVCSLALSRDGALLASGSGNGAVKVWDGTSYAKIATLNPRRGSRADVDAVAFSPEGSKLAVTMGGVLVMYDFHAHDRVIQQWLREAGVDVDLNSQ